jgi:hypothetical protein
VKTHSAYAAACSRSLAPAASTAAPTHPAAAPSTKAGTLHAGPAAVGVTLGGVARADALERVVAPAPAVSSTTANAASAVGGVADISPASAITHPGTVPSRAVTSTDIATTILGTRIGAGDVARISLARGVIAIRDALAMARVMLPAVAVTLYLATVEVAVDVRSLVHIDVDSWSSRTRFIADQQTQQMTPHADAPHWPSAAR